jgi:hypothetical protein
VAQARRLAADELCIILATPGGAAQHHHQQRLPPRQPFYRGCVRAHGPLVANGGRPRARPCRAATHPSAALLLPRRVHRHPAVRAGHLPGGQPLHAGRKVRARAVVCPAASL